MKLLCIQLPLSVSKFFFFFPFFYAQEKSLQPFKVYKYTFMCLLLDIYFLNPPEFILVYATK